MIELFLHIVFLEPQILMNYISLLSKKQFEVFLKIFNYPKYKYK